MTEARDRARSRTFVVTGAASGIGLAAAQRLLAEGGTVVGAERQSCADTTAYAFARTLGEQFSVKIFVAAPNCAGACSRHWVVKA